MAGLFDGNRADTVALDTTARHNEFPYRLEARPTPSRAMQIAVRWSPQC